MREKRVVQACDILAANDLAERVWVPTPEWGAGNDGAGVYVRVMSGTERDAWERSIEDDATRYDHARARLVTLSACDADGNLLFTAKDIDWLSQKNGVVLTRIATAASKLNKLGREDLEVLEGNSGAAPGGASSCSSPSAAASHPADSSRNGPDQS